MDKQDLIPCDEICVHYRIEQSFIRELQEHDLVAFRLEKESFYLPADHLPDLERFIRLHYDLNINLEGLEAVSHLLKQIDDMQDKMRQLQNRLHLYED